MTQTIHDMIANLSPKELETLLKNMRTYQACKKVSHTRADELYTHKTTGILRKKVEHFGPFGAQQKLLIQLYVDTFHVTDADIQFVQNDALDGGVRMFYGDDMVELSLRDFERHLLSIS